jgi:RimJ/RimL family protein N-acetyltransferase
LVASTDEHLTAVLPELHGPGIRLRGWDAESDADVAAWLRGTTDPEFRRWNTPHRPIADARGARDSLRAKTRLTAEGSAASYCVVDAASGTVLGHVGVNAIDTVQRVGRVGYWVLPEARGRGVAVGALAVASRWALTELALHRLELGHALGHEISCRVAERCGYRYEGTLRGAMFEAGRYDTFRDAHLHGRLATDAEPEIPWRGSETGRRPGPP